jgi:hypothetical protein
MFEEFWKLYPWKVAKRPAEKEWMKLTEEEKAAAMKALPAHLKYWNSGAEFVPHPPHARTWLHQGRWLDELPAEKVNGKPWHETKSGVEAKGAELGILPDQFEHWQWFRNAVMKAAA